MTELTIPTIPDVLTEEEGMSLLLRLQTEVEGHVGRSGEELTLAVVKLHLIREHALFRYSGDIDWGYWLKNYLDETGISRAWIYRLLRAARVWALGMDLPLELLLEHGIHTAHTLREKLVKKHDRETGKIEQIEPGVYEYLRAGDDPIGHRLGEWIAANLDSGHPLKIVHDATDEMASPRIKYSGVYQANKLVDLEWHVKFPDGTEDGDHGMATFPPFVMVDFHEKLGMDPDMFQYGGGENGQT